MQDLRRLILALALLLAAAGPAAAAEPRSVRVMTWNLQWFPGGSPGASEEEGWRQAAEVAGTISAVSPDILVLQEVRSEQAVVDLLRSARSPMVVVVVSRFTEQGGVIGRQQLAICSRFPATSAWSAAWERGWAGAPRGYAYARLDVGGRVVHVYGLHLKSNLGRDPALNASKREDAVEQLLRHAAAMGKESGPAIALVAGDFNVGPEARRFRGERTLALMTEAGFEWTFAGVPPGDRVTIRGTRGLPDATFDHVYVKGLGRPVARVIGDARGSDHLPVVVDVPLN